MQFVVERYLMGFQPRDPGAEDVQWIPVFIILLIAAIGLTYLLWGPKKKDPARKQRLHPPVIIPIVQYREYFMELERILQTRDIQQIYQRHAALCARCGVRFTPEALTQLYLFGPGGAFRPNVQVIGASQEGIAIRAGKCPYCGHTRMKIIFLAEPADEPAAGSSPTPTAEAAQADNASPMGSEGGEPGSDSSAAPAQNRVQEEHQPAAQSSSLPEEPAAAENSAEPAGGDRQTALAGSSRERPLSAVLWKLFVGGLIVNAISGAGLFAVGALSVLFRLSSYNNFLLALIPVTLDGLIVYGAYLLIGKLFFGRSGRLDRKRWERYLLGEMPGFFLSAFLLAVFVALGLPDRSSGSYSRALISTPGAAILTFATLLGFGLGLFSILTHASKDAAAVRQAEQKEQKAQALPPQPQEQGQAPRPTAGQAAPALFPPNPSPAAPKRNMWPLLLLSLLVIGILISIYWARSLSFGPDPAGIPAAQPQPTRGQQSDPPAQPRAGCRLWSDVQPADAGKTLCAYGVVKSAYPGGGLTYITFSDEKSAFRFVNLDGKDYSGFVNRCVTAEGEVKTFGKIAYIEVAGEMDLCQ